MNNIKVNSSEFNISISEVNNGRLSIASADNMLDGNWWISRVNVQCTEKGQGLGSKLLNRLIEEILFYGETNIIVAPGGYMSDSAKQFNFYKKNGFVDGNEEGLLIYKKQ